MLGRVHISPQDVKPRKKRARVVARRCSAKVPRALSVAKAEPPTMLMPETSTLANRNVVMPPRTASGIEAMAAPNFLRARGNGNQKRESAVY